MLLLQFICTWTAICGKADTVLQGEQLPEFDCPDSQLCPTPSIGFSIRPLGEQIPKKEFYEIASQTGGDDDDAIIINIIICVRYMYGVGKGGYGGHPCVGHTAWVMKDEVK